MTLPLILTIFLISTRQCACTDENVNDSINYESENGSELNSSSGMYRNNETHIKQLNVPFETNTASGLNHDNITDATKIPWTSESPEKELPLALIIAGPTAAVFVFLFLCIAFYFHNLQLNQKAAQLSLTLYVTQDSGSETVDGEPELPVVTKIETTPTELVNITRKFSVQSLRLSIDNSAQPPLHLARENSSQSMRRSMDSELFLPPRKNAISQGLPSRGSTLSAFADQEIVNQSAKRKKHSIFFI